MSLKNGPASGIPLIGIESLPHFRVLRRFPWLRIWLIRRKRARPVTRFASDGCSRVHVKRGKWVGVWGRQLGLEAQRNSVEAYSDRMECTVVAEFVEVETAKRNDRP